MRTNRTRLYYCVLYVLLLELFPKLRIYFAKSSLITPGTFPEVTNPDFPHLTYVILSEVHICTDIAINQLMIEESLGLSLGLSLGTKSRTKSR